MDDHFDSVTAKKTRSFSYEDVNQDSGDERSVWCSCKGRSGDNGFGKSDDRISEDGAEGNNTDESGGVPSDEMQEYETEESKEVFKADF